MNSRPTSLSPQDANKVGPHAQGPGPRRLATCASDLLACLQCVCQEQLTQEGGSRTTSICKGANVQKHYHARDSQMGVSEN